MSGIIAQNAANATGLIKAAAAGGAWTKIKTLTASSSATLSFVNGSSDVVLDNTYPIYKFEFISIHPSAADGIFQFNGSDDTSSHSYDITKTTTVFSAHHLEDDSGTDLSYQTGYDLAQGTGFQYLTGGGINNNNDDCAAGYLYLFEPSSTTFVKHFIARTNFVSSNPYSRDHYLAGYFNTTAAITALQFSMTSGNIDAGDICLYGLS